MSEPQQPRGWRESRYERPQDTWVCGRLCGGDSCALGPTRRGDCPSSEEPCRPVRSLAQRRRIVAGSVAALCLAACLVIAGGRPSESLSAGPLAASHATPDMSCADCHGASPDAWLTSVFDGETRFGASKRCLACHDDLAQVPLGVHGLAADDVATLTKKAGRATSEAPLLTALSAALVDHSADRELACSSCHHEHQGRHHDLTAMAADRCQVCHTARFESFETGHPEFVAYPYERPRRIIFDHATHFERYFQDDARRLMPDALAPADCTACHEPSLDGRVMLTGRFEVMCAACHERGIEDRDFPGVPFLALPRRPVLAGDEEVDRALGEWPARRLEPPLPVEPFFQRLLLADALRLEMAAGERAAEEALRHPLALKRLFYDVARGGQETLRTRLPAELKPLATAEPSIVPSMLQAQQSWFPHLIEERETGVPAPATTALPAVTSHVPESEIGGGWFVRQADHSVRYRPLGHADPLIRDWIDAALAPESQEPSLCGAVDELLAILGQPSASGTVGTRGPVASGRCLSCHTVSVDRSTGRRQVDWDARGERDWQRPLTVFRHGPHLVGDSSCRDCHSLDDRVSGSTGDRVSDFLPIRKLDCATCHHRESGLDDCTDCHRYHARSTPRSVVGRMR